MAEAVRVRVYDSRIQSMFAPGGDVWGFARKLGRETMITAQDAPPLGAPEDTGQLKLGIEFSVTPVPHGCITTVRSTAPHSLWVHEGTRTPIYPRDSRWLRIPPGRGHTRARYLRWVNGQSPNPFLTRAMRFVLTANGI